MNPPERYHLAAPLPAAGGWRRALALDRRPGAAAPVVLSFAPAALLEDAARLAALVRDAEAAARVAHPNVVPVAGLETVDEQLALVEPYCAGTTLRAVLDASGRLPPDLAVRVALDACAGLAAVHAVDPGDGQPLAHGALTAERLLLTEEGVTRVAGVGAGAGRSAAADIRALAAVLYEALSGEPPAAPASHLDVPGIPAALAAVVDGALGGEGAFPSAGAFSAALSTALTPAPAGTLAAYAEAVRPAAPEPEGSPAPAPEGPGASAAPAAPLAQPAPPAVPRPAAPPVAAAPPAVPARSPAAVAAPPPLPTTEPLEVSAELMAPSPWEARDVEPTGPMQLEHDGPPPDAAITFPAPELVDAGRGRLAAVLAALLLAGFATGFALARMRPQEAGAPLPPPPRAEAAPPTEAPPPSPAEPPAAVPAPAPAAAPATPPRRNEGAPAKAGHSLAISATPAAEVLVDGKRCGRSPVTVPVAAGEHEVRLADAAQGIDVRRRVVARGPGTPVRIALARGELQITAPADAEIWLDGRRLGNGNARVALWEGPHRVEARRAGARVQKKFEVTALQTQWTFDVTPTP